MASVGAPALGSIIGIEHFPTPMNPRARCPIALILFGAALSIFSFVSGKDDPRSLFSMIASGRAKIVSSDPEEIERIKRTAESRQQWNLASKLVTSQENELRTQFHDSLANTSASDIGILIHRNDKTIAHGMIVDSSNGFAVAPLDLVLPIADPTTISHAGESYPVLEITPLSSADNLALIKIATNSLPNSNGTDLSADPNDLPREEAGLRESISILENPSNPAQIGSFIGTLVQQDDWNTGTLSTDLFAATTKANPSATSQAIESHWNRIGLKVSHQRTGYPEVFSCDLQVNPEQCGGPVFDLSGNLLGITIARVDLHATYVLPIHRITEALSRNNSEDQVSKNR